MSSRSSPSDPLHEQGLFARAQAGDQDAWRELFHKCYPKIQRYVRRRIDTRLRRHVDSTDIANDVFTELALKASKFHFDSLDDVENFLVDTAHKRVIDEYRRHQARKRNSGLDRPLAGTAGGEEGAWALSSGEPTPSQHAVAHETDDLLRAATDDVGRRVIELRGLHYNNNEISSLTGWSTRKIQRFLEDLRPISSY